MGTGMRNTLDGLPVLNAKRGVKLHVIDNDIKRADRKVPEDCVVARTCRRQMHAKEVRVHLGRVYVRQNAGNWLRYMTPRSLRTEIISYDRGGRFEPGEYHLSAPTPTARKAGHQGSAWARPKKGRKGKKRRPMHVVTDVRIGPAS